LIAQNTFDLGYELVWVGHCRAHLKKFNALPIIEFYKSNYVDEWSGKKVSTWSFRELAMTDVEIDKALPNNWKFKRVSGFSKFNELHEWLCSHSTYLRNS
jgi:hypothetical protein